MNKIIDSELPDQIVDKYHTPLYIYGQSEIEHNINNLIDAISPQTKIFYSMKANPNPEIIKLVTSKAFGVEVSSGGELEIALMAGIAPNRITFSGPAKTDDELELAIKTKLFAVNVESLSELKRINVIGERFKIKTNITIRVNPRHIIKSARIKMGGSASQFGFDEEIIPELLKSLGGFSHINFMGIHAYAGTQILNATDLVQFVEYIIAKGAAWSQAHNIAIVNIGLGLGVPYFKDQSPLAMNEIKRYFKKLYSNTSDDYNFKNINLYVEVGRYLVATAGCYVTTIIDIKQSRGKNFIILDGGINHNFSSINMGNILRQNYKIQILKKACSHKNTIIADIVGPLCTSLDTIGYEVKVPSDVQIGDVVIFENSGAYCKTASPLNFLSHDWPTEILVDNQGQYRCIARRVTAKELMKFQTTL